MPYFDALPIRTHQCAAIQSFAFPGVEFEKHRAVDCLANRLFERLALLSRNRSANVLGALTDQRSALAQHGFAFVG